MSSRLTVTTNEGTTIEGFEAKSPLNYPPLAQSMSPGKLSLIGE